MMTHETTSQPKYQNSINNLHLPVCSSSSLMPSLSSPLPEVASTLSLHLPDRVWTFQICQSVCDAVYEGTLANSQRNSLVTRAYFATAGRSVTVFAAIQGLNLHTDSIPPEGAAEHRTVSMGQKSGRSAFILTSIGMNQLYDLSLIM